MAESHIRIDEGIKRGPRIQRKSRARTDKGTLVPFDPVLKANIIEDSIPSLQRGETTDQIGARHGVAGRTVRAWLIGSEEAEQARRLLIASQLTRTMDEINTADAPMPLARAREEFRAWSWIAERRESRLYGQKQELTVKAEIKMEGVLDSLSQSILERIAASKQLPQVIDLPSDAVHQLEIKPE